MAEQHMAVAQGQPTTVLLYKPYGVLSQFTPETGSRWRCLADFVDIPNVYAAGRLDADSEGLLLLTDNGRLQRQLTAPEYGHWRTYWSQVEGIANGDQLRQLESGVPIKGKPTLPARANLLPESMTSELPEREPPIRFRASIPTSWVELSLREGRNRQVRRMTAAVGLPTLRLIRVSIDLMDGGPPLTLDGLRPGEWRFCSTSETRRLRRLLSNRPANRPAGRQRA